MQQYLPLHGEDLRRELSQYRRLVAGTSADLKHTVTGIQGKRLQHGCDDIRLRDGLSGFYLDGLVFIGERLLIGRDKQMPGNAFHGTQDALILDAALAKL